MTMRVEDGLIVIERSAKALEAYLGDEGPMVMYSPRACAVCATGFNEDPQRWATDRQRSLDALSMIKSDPIVEEAKRALAMGPDQRLCNSCHLYATHGIAGVVCDDWDDRYGETESLEPKAIMLGLIEYATSLWRFARGPQEWEHDPRMIRGSFARRLQIVLDRITDLEQALQLGADPIALDIKSLKQIRLQEPVMHALYSAEPALMRIYEAEDGRASEEDRPIHRLLCVLRDMEKSNG